MVAIGVDVFMCMCKTEHMTNPRLTGDDPVQIGWYATLHTWDPLEGLIPGAHYWDGKLWRTELRGITPSASVIHWSILFETKEEAEAYATAHDPDNK